MKMKKRPAKDISQFGLDVLIRSDLEPHWATFAIGNRAVLIVSAWAQKFLRRRLARHICSSTMCQPRGGTRRTSVLFQLHLGGYCCAHWLVVDRPIRGGGGVRTVSCLHDG